MLRSGALRHAPGQSYNAFSGSNISTSRISRGSSPDILTDAWSAQGPAKRSYMIA